MKFTLSLNDLKILCSIGVADLEREKKQELRLDIELQKDLSLACQSDQIQETINYDEIVAHCLQIASLREYCLIEALAYAIFHEIWRAFSPNYLKITLKKRARADISFASIILEEGRK